MKIAALTPARLASTRFPEKPLALILEKPMILWVCELTSKAVGRDNTYVATDSERIATVVRDAGFQAVMTQPEAFTGTDRIAEAIQTIDADLFINVQGDEPMLDPASITKVIDEALAHSGSIVNGYAPISEKEDPTSVNIPKCVIASDGRLLYMSRLAVPGFKSKYKAPCVYYKQVCIYAFTREHLEQYSSATKKAPCEASEDIEILRFLDMGYEVRMIELAGDTLAVDVPGDIFAVEEVMRKTV